GEAAFFDQQSTGLSSIKVRQGEHQDLHADQVTNLTQKQYGPQWVDPDQGSNQGDSYDITQDSNQNASNPSDQQDEQYAQCFTSGNCSVSEKIHQENVSQTNSCSGPSCDIGNSIDNGDTGSCTATPNLNIDAFVGTCLPEGTPDPPQSPPND